MVGDPLDDRPQLQAHEREQHGIEDEGEDLPDRLSLQPRPRGRQLGRVPAHVEAHRHRRQYRRDVERLRRQIGEVAGEERDRDLRRRVVEAAPHLADDEADGEADGDSARDRDEELPGRVAEREGAGDDRDDCEPVDDERGRVVQQPLALDHGDEAAR